MAKNKKRKKAKIVSLNPQISPSKYIRTVARKLPLYKAYVSEGILDKGIGYAIVVRQKRNGDKVLAVYLLDTWCLGVKDTFFKILPSYEYDEFMEDLFDSFPETMLDTNSTYVYNLIYGAVEYAEDLGLSPHKDFLTTQFILDDVSDFDFMEIEFGNNGKPCYVSGPFDNPGKIMNILNKHVGPNAFDFVCAIDEEGEFDMVDIIDEILTEKEDREDYFSYLDLLMVITELFSEEEERLMELYLYDHSTLQKEISENMKLMEDGIFTNSMIPLYLILPVAEKFLIYKGPDFLDEEEFIESFISKPSGFNLIQRTFNRIILNNSGIDKINMLLTALATLISERNASSESKKEYLLAHKNRIPEEMNKMKEELPIEVFNVLEHINMHESTFGALIKEDLEIIKL